MILIFLEFCGYELDDNTNSHFQLVRKKNQRQENKCLKCNRIQYLVKFKQYTLQDCNPKTSILKISGHVHNRLLNIYRHPHQTLAAIISANKESPYFLTHDNGMCYFIIESNISEAPCIIKQSKVVITQQPTLMISANLYAFDMSIHPPVAYQGSLYLHYGQRTIKVTGQHYNFAVGNAYPLKVNEQLYLCQNQISYLNDKPFGQCKDIRCMKKLGIQNRDIQQFTIGKYIITFNQQHIEVLWCPSQL
ncbi:Hypothetical_protein [Hexamita inflata]|uniref:Hypothetical_protein n=1 Tax=Hexamita inflata TaxID=28002 RepID=A0AA86RID7_9EUKA|nr:Hypothetical protein HINF_LOCUS64767 [Hexamita inflata]